MRAFLSSPQLVFSALTRNSYEGKIDKYNFGSLIRTASEDEYSQFNSIFVVRMQVRRT